MEFQPNNNYLSLFKKNKLDINIKTLLIGLHGPGKMGACISARDVTEWAMDQYLGGKAAMEKRAFSDPKNLSDIYQELAHLSENDENLNEDEKKWVLVLLKNLLENLPNNPTEGLCDLQGFWAELDYPPYRPAIIQGVDIKLNPNDYYTTSTYELAIKNHHTWAEKMHNKLMIRDTM